MHSSVRCCWPQQTKRPARRVAIVYVAAALIAAACGPLATSGPLSGSGSIKLNASGEDIVVRTNAQRELLGLPVLRRSTHLMSAAQLQADQMAALNTMAHELSGASYPSPSSRLDAVGYRMSASAENVAEGYPTSAAVVAGWMTSPGHRSNIVSTAFTEMGAGYAAGKNGRKYYAQVFGRPR
jgi:uncharacterized protein YkwD